MFNTVGVCPSCGSICPTAPYIRGRQLNCKSCAEDFVAYEGHENRSAEVAVDYDNKAYISATSYDRYADTLHIKIKLKSEYHEAPTGRTCEISPQGIQRYSERKLEAPFKLAIQFMYKQLKDNPHILEIVIMSERIEEILFNKKEGSHDEN